MPLSFQATPTSGRAAVGEEAHRLARWKTPPPGRWRLPSFQARTPVFSMVYLAGRPYLLVLDKKKSTHPFYDRLYFDTDGDGDLTDSPPLEGKAFSRGMGFYYSIFPPLELALPISGAKVPYRLEIRAHKRASFQGFRGRGGRSASVEDVALFMVTSCQYRGTLRWGGKTFHLALTDANGDGIFGDAPAGSSRPQGAQEPSHREDRLYLGAGPDLSLMEDLRTSGLLSMGGVLHKVLFDQAEGRLTLEPIPAPGARLAFPVKTERLKIFGLEGAKDILFLGAGLEEPVPPGLYRLGCYVLAKKDGGGNTWILKAKAPPGAPPVRAGSSPPEKMVFGEPYTPVVHVRARFPRRLRRRVVTANLEFQVLGAGGEEVFHLSASTDHPSEIARSVKLPRLPLEPRFTILELPGGKTAAQGEFEYG